MKTVKNLWLIALLCVLGVGNVSAQTSWRGERSGAEHVATFRFIVGDDGFNTSSSGNGEELEELYALVDRFRGQISVGEMRLYVDAYGSSSAKGRSTANSRSGSVKWTLIAHRKFVEKNIVARDIASAYVDREGVSHDNVVIVTLRVPAVYDLPSTAIGLENRPLAERSEADQPSPAPRQRTLAVAAPKPSKTTKPAVEKEPEVKEPTPEKEVVAAKEPRPAKEPKVKEPKPAKEPKVKEPKEPKAPKEPKQPKEPKEPKQPKAAKEPKVKEPQQPKEAKVKEPRPMKEPQVRAAKEPREPREPREPKARPEKESADVRRLKAENDRLAKDNERLETRLADQRRTSNNNRQTAPRSGASSSAIEPFSFDIRTNLLYDAFLMPTLGVEWHITPRVGLKLDGSLSRWGSGYGVTQRLWILNPEVRYYFPKNDRFYIGASINYSRYNIHRGMVGGIFSNTTGYQGSMWNAGVTAGYRLPIVSGLSIDFNLGLGYVRSEYDSFTIEEGERMLKERGRMSHIFGPTQVGINLIWTIGGGKK